MQFEEIRLAESPGVTVEISETARLPQCVR